MNKGNESILKEILKLDLPEQLNIWEQWIHTIRKQLLLARGHSILELRGLGKEIWQSIDIEQYIDQERSSWNG